MKTRIPFAACLVASLVASPFSALAGSHQAPGGMGQAAASPDFVFSLGGGVGTMPAYFGSSDYVVGPAFDFDFQYLRLGKNRSIGSLDPDAVATGLAPRFSFRLVKERTAADNPELTGMNDLDLSVEMGMGVVYNQQNYSVFADARYGVVGHESWVGEVGADVIAKPTEDLTLRLGPRMFLGDSNYASHYFGVTAAESAASGLTAFAADGGALSAGLELNATYQLNDTWGLNGTLRYDRLLNDAANSPITGLGSEDQFSASVTLTRRFVLDF